MGAASAASAAEAQRYSANNYNPLPVVLAEADGAWVTDVDGRRYLDCLAGYSALNFGHRHPALIEAARKQLDQVTLTSRAFLHDKLGPFCQAVAQMCGKERVLPMNTGAEAVETGVKVARKWGYEVKGVADGQASIVVAAENFHGRTTTIISFSTDPTARKGFGPYTPGFRVVPFGDIEAMRAAIDETTVAVLIEPIQGEAGVVVPPAGYLPAVRALCTERNVLMIADEVQSGLGRTGRTLACEHEGVVPDMYLLGKALGGGVVPVSAVVANEDVLGVIKPGEHGSTFGGNPLACAVGIAVTELLRTGEFQERAEAMGDLLHKRLGELLGRGVTEIRGRGLWAGVDIDPALMTGREACERMLRPSRSVARTGAGVLAKDTHGRTLRLAPPLMISEDDVQFAVDHLAEVLGA